MNAPTHKKTVFLTGATGLVGSYLLKILLRHGHKVYCLARSQKGKSAKKRVVDILNFWDKKVYPKYCRNLIVLEGDITKKDLGLNPSGLKKLRQETEEIFHSAAITDINWPLKEIRKVNVEGTKHVLGFALKCKRLVKVNHISTAYVLGKFKGEFDETNFRCGQRFSSNYERSKFESERLISQYRERGLWIDIFRPSMILGESKTGKTFQFKHIYQAVNLCKLELFNALPVYLGKVCLVPIDVTSKAIYLLASSNMNHNMTFHPFPKNLFSVKTIIQIGSKVLGYRVPQIVPINKMRFSTLTPTQRRILASSFLSLNLKMKLRSNITNNILKTYNFLIPNISNAILIKTLKYFQKEKKNEIVSNN